MPKIDFKNVDDVQDFPPVPDGKYRCRVAEVETTFTRHNDEMWKVRFLITDGPYQERYIRDNIVFSKAAYPRVKLICSCLGLKVSGEIDLTTDLIIGRNCNVTVINEEYEGTGGETKKRNKVPFAGYEPGDGSTIGDGISKPDRDMETVCEDDIPF